MDDKSIPYVRVCYDVRDMDWKFNEALNAFSGLIAKCRKADWRIELIDGSVLLFVTEKTFRNGVWVQGRTYKIVGDGGTVYHGKYPLKNRNEMEVIRHVQRDQ